MSVKNANMKFYEIDIDGKIERWERVKQVLVKMTPHEVEKHFDMRQWGIKTSCGTVGCAAGHCGLDPWFHRRGFKMSFKKVPESFYYPEGFYYPVWDGLNPNDFFGSTGYWKIFTNSKLFIDNNGNDIPPKNAHRNVVAAVRKYLKDLMAFKKSGGGA